MDHDQKNFYGHKSKKLCFKRKQKNSLCKKVQKKLYTFVAKSVKRNLD